MKYAPDHVALAGRDLTAGNAIEGSKFECVIIMSAARTEEVSVSVYPNPASEYVCIEATDAQQMLDVTLVDLYGREVVRERAVGSLRIGTSSLSDGVFILRVNNHATKILKQSKAR